MKRYLLYGLVALFCIYWSFSAYKIYRAFTYDFNGRIQSINYESGKYLPTIKVNNKQFDLECVRWIGDEDSLVVGDSVVKHKGSQWMTVLKKNPRGLTRT